jgi:hypothetical protein
MPKALYTLRKKGRNPAAYIAGSFWWMGSCIVRVHIPQVKLEVEGRKDPYPPRGRRSRGTRGRRRGRARVGKTRRSLRAALVPAKSLCVKGTSVSKHVGPNRLSKVRARRVRWLEGRFSHVGETDPNLRYQFRKFHPGGWNFESRSVRKARLRTLIKTLTKKKMPRPPGLSIDDWVRRAMELKYGTWEDVSIRLVDGEHSLGHSFEAPTSVERRLDTGTPDRLQCLSCGFRVFLRAPVCQKCGTSARPRFILARAVKDGFRLG